MSGLKYKTRPIVKRTSLDYFGRFDFDIFCKLLLQMFYSISPCWKSDNAAGKVDVLVGLPIELWKVITETMEQRTLKYVSNCLNTNIYSYLEASGANVIKQYSSKLPP